MSGLHTPRATVTFCRLTGRMCSLWIEDEPGYADRALFDSVTAGPRWTAEDPFADRRRPVRVALAAEPVLAELATLARLSDDRRSTLGSDHVAAGVVLDAEWLVAVTKARDRQPGLVSADAVARTISSAEAAARAWISADSTSPFEPAVTPGRLEAGLSRLSDELTVLVPSARWTRAAVVRISERTTAADRRTGPPPPTPVTTLGPSPGDVAPTRNDGCTAHQPRFVAPIPPCPSVNQHDDPTATRRIIRLGDLAARDIGLDLLEVRISEGDRWLDVQGPLGDRARHPGGWWCIAHRRGQPVGVGPLDLVDGEALAAVAVTAIPDEIDVRRNPFRRDVGPTLADVAAAITLGREAWRTRARTGRTATADWLRCCTAWLEVGRIAPAAWAWVLAGSPDLTEELSVRLDPESAAVVIAGLHATAEAGLIPPLVTSGDPSLWHHLVGRRADDPSVRTGWQRSTADGPNGSRR